MAGLWPVFLSLCCLDVNTAAVKELRHGPSTSSLCEMNFDLAASPLLRNKRVPRRSDGTVFVRETAT